MPSNIPIVRMGICTAEVADEVEPSGPDERVEAQDAETHVPFPPAAFIFLGVNTHAASSHGGGNGSAGPPR